MKQKKNISAARRQVKKEPEKGIKGLLNRIKRALKRNNTLTVISIAVAILVAAIPFGYTISKDKRSVKVYIGDFELKDDSHTTILYLCPISEIKSTQIYGTLPLIYKNDISNNVENFCGDIAFRLRELSTASVPNVENTIIKKTTLKEFEVPRYREEKETIGALRNTFRFSENKAIVRYEIKDFNSKVQFDTSEEFRIELDRFAKDEELNSGKSKVTDSFDIDLHFSYKNISKTYYASLAVAVLDFNNLDSLINYIDVRGSTPFYSPYFDLESGKYVVLNKYLVVVPSILYDEESGNYKMDKNNMKIYEIEYDSKDFYYDRRLIINNGKKKKKIAFPDLDLTIPNTMKTLNIVNEKTLKIMRERNQDDF